MSRVCSGSLSRENPFLNGKMAESYETGSLEGDSKEPETRTAEETKQQAKKKMADKSRSSKAGTHDLEKKEKFLIRDEASEVKVIVEKAGEPEDKLKEVYARFQGLVKEYKRLEKKVVEGQRKVSELSRLKDATQGELARATTAKTKLESLCRELQKQNKAIQEESRQRTYEEEKKRQEVSAKFQDTIDEVAGKLHDHYEKNQELKDENTGLAQQLKSIVDQCESRELTFDKILQQKQLELQLAEAKLAQQRVASAQEKETHETEKQLLMVQLREYQKRCELLTEQEEELRKQLSLYSEKFEEFQETLSKSNSVFATYKKEMDKMTKAVGHSEKEVVTWKAKYHKCNESLVEMVERHMASETAAQALRAKNDKLESLCRALQQERNKLNEQLKGFQSQKVQPSEEVADKGHDSE